MMVPDSTGRCPHCGLTVRFIALWWHDDWGHHFSVPETGSLESGVKGEHTAHVAMSMCPNCLRAVIAIAEVGADEVPSAEDYVLAWPRASTRGPVPSEVPQALVADYAEAALVLSMSPKASAALSRRCLQNVLCEAAGAKRSATLEKQIDEVLPALPNYLQPHLDAVRQIGNFAAHPMKSTSTSEIVDVEEGEAEWNLDVLDELFDFYYSKPAEAAERFAKLNGKLKDAGKQPLPTG